MKRLIVLFATLLVIPIAQATTTVTGSIKNLGTAAVTPNAFVRFWLRGCAGNQPRVNGAAVIGPSQGGVFFFDIAADSNGNISGTIYSTRDSTGLLAGDIECGGSLTAVWYGMQIFVAGKGGPEIPVHAKNSSILDITQVTPITTNPVVTPPTGDSTYLRLDAGNSPVTGSLRTKYLNGVRYTSQFSSIQAAINDAVAAGGTSGGAVVIDLSATISSTVTVGQNSPSASPITLIIPRGVVLTASATGFTNNTLDVFQLSNGSKIRCEGVDGVQQITLANNAAVRDVFRAINQDASQESMVVEGCGVNANSSGGASVVSILNASELFEGTYFHDLQFNGVQGPGGNNACAIKVFTVASATDGAAQIDFRNIWITTATGNNQGLCIDGTGNTTVNINRLNFDSVIFNQANGTTNGEVTIKSGANGQIKQLRFRNIGMLTALTNTSCAVTLNGLYGSHFDDWLIASSSGTGETGICLNNNANQQNFQNVFSNIFLTNGFATALISDARTPAAGGSAQTITDASGGGFIKYYAQDDGQTIQPRWNYAGLTIPSNIAAGNKFVFDTATQNVNNKTLGSTIIGTQNPTALGGLGFDGITHLVVGDGTNSNNVPILIGSGTATMTTAAIASGVCGTTVTVASSRVLTTDVITFNFNGTPGANPGTLILTAWPTAGNVNFAYCNPTAGSITPNAATLNWAVIR